MIVHKTMIYKGKLMNTSLFFYFAVLWISYADDVNTYKKWELFEFRINQATITSKTTRNQLFADIENLENVKIIDTFKGGFQIGIGPLADKQKLQNLIKSYNITAKSQHKDISKLVAKTHSKTSKRSVGDSHFERYMTYEQIESFFDLLESSYPKTIQRRVIGQSHEKRNISLFVVSSTGELSCKSKEETKAPSSSNSLGDIGQNILNAAIERGKAFRRVERQQLQLQNRRLLILQQQSFDRKRLPLRRSPSWLAKRRRRRQSLTRADNGTFKFIYFNFDKFGHPELAKKANELKKSEKPIIFIDAGLHSREWVSPAAALYLIKVLAETPSLTSHIDWYIMPLVNPDGYEFSWHGDRFWRKTRSKSGTSGCYGTDMNRNFDHRWGEVDTSLNPCSEHYGGTGPNSEIETLLMKDVLTKEKDRLKAYISLHNWGQDILYPYSYDDTASPTTVAELDRVGKSMADAIKTTRNIDYKTGRGSVLLYPASGTSIDWAYDVLGVPYCYLIELRDKVGILGFLLPDVYIKPTSEDLVAAMKALAEEIAKEKIKLCNT